MMKTKGSARRCRNTIPLRVRAIVSFSPGTIVTRHEMLNEIEPHGLGFVTVQVVDAPASSEGAGTALRWARTAAER